MKSDLVSIIIHVRVGKDNYLKQQSKMFKINKQKQQQQQQQHPSDYSVRRPLPSTSPTNEKSATNSTKID